MTDADIEFANEYNPEGFRRFMGCIFFLVEIIALTLLGLAGAGIVELIKYLK